MVHSLKLVMLFMFFLFIEAIQHSKVKPSPKAVFSRSTSSKEDSRKSASDLAHVSPTPAAKPPRKRISPPKYTSAERRAAERRPSPPIRRRIIIANVGGGNPSGGLRVQNRYRDIRRGAIPSKSRSRSPNIRFFKK